MSSPSPVLTDAFRLLSVNLYTHLDEAESLATQHAEWAPEDIFRAGNLIGDLVLVVRGLLIEHELQASNNCRICDLSWPCPVITTIHAFVKDPRRQFVALLDRASDNECSSLPYT